MKPFKIIKNQRGFALALFCFLLPLFLLIALLTIDGGLLYIRQLEIQNLADSAAKSGLTEVSLALADQAEINLEEICDVEEPPEKCENPKINNFLSVEEARHIAADPNIAPLIAAQTRNFIQTFDTAGKEKITDSDINVEYPYKFDPNQNGVAIKVTVKTDFARPFVKIVNLKDIPQASVTASSIQILPIR